MMPPLLESTRLRLRPFRDEDTGPITEFCGDLAVSRWLTSVPHPYPAWAAKGFISKAQGPGEVHWAIERAGIPGLIGVIGMNRAKEGAHLGYWVAPPYWGQGLASEAAGMVVAWAFTEARHPALTSGAFAGNHASLRIQEKLGFRETVRRARYCLALDRPMMHIDTRLDREDWQGQGAQSDQEAGA
ncbi:MAG: GNAT family N-acetyltransferase [Pseudomonadota bacterium]